MKKKTEEITTLYVDDMDNLDSLSVSKCYPLFSLGRSDITLSEFKIIDTYSARINSHNPSQRRVVLRKGALEKCLGVTRISKENLEIRLKHLMGTVVKIEDKTEKNGFRLLTLFEEAELQQDDDGLWNISLECTEKAMKYFFGIEELGYLRYMLRCTSLITSRYTYLMFLYIEANRWRGSWEIDVEELKFILNCENEETYKQFKRFNDLILKKVKKEMFEKTECRYNYEPIRKGRSVSKIKFTVDKLPKYIDENIDISEIPCDDNELGLLFLQPLKEFNFSREELDEITSLVSVVPPYKMPQLYASMDDIDDIVRYHYIDLKVKEIKRRDKSKTIKNKFSYLVKMIKQDCEV